MFKDAYGNINPDPGSFDRDSYNIFWEDVYALAKDDVISFYDLRDKYNSPLTKKRFMESDEYQQLASEFNYIKNNFDKLLFFVVADNYTQYDLESGTFRFSLPEMRHVSYVRVQGLDQDFDYVPCISTPKIDEDTAFQIETNPCQIAFFGKIIINYDGNEPGFKIEKVVVYNKNTGNIYYEFKTSTPEQSNDGDLPSKEVKGIDLSPVEKLFNDANYCNLLKIIDSGLPDFAKGTNDKDSEQIISWEKVNALVNNDVISYYDLSERYDSPLTKKQFMESTN